MKIKKGKFQLPKQIQSVELLRGIASAMVCYYHLAKGNVNFLPDQSIIKRTATWGWSGVEIFFVISGFVIPFAMFQKKYEIRNFFTFLKKRIIRIEPPYLISIILVIFLNFISTLSPYYRGKAFHINWPNLFGHIAYLNVFTGGKWLIDVYWSLAIEFQYYLFIAICFALIVSDKIYWRLLFIILFLLSSLIPFPPNSFVFAYSPYFIAGILLFQLVCSITGLAEFFIYMALMTGFLAYEQGIVLICIVLITMLVILFINRVPAFLRYMGLISYSLYLTHVPIGGRIINITEVKTSNILAREMMVFAAFLVCIFAASVFYWLFEKRFKIFSGSIKYDHDSSNYKTVQPYNSQV